MDFREIKAWNVRVLGEGLLLVPGVRQVGVGLARLVVEMASAAHSLGLWS